MQRQIRWIAAIALAAAAVSVASANTWQPTGAQQMPLWPDRAAIARPAVSAPESVRQGKTLTAGRPSTIVENVVQPTLSVYPAQAPNSGAAVIVFPGGGYQILAIDIEGSEVCDWITRKGVTCAVLKYRVPGGGPYGLVMPRVPMALQDAQRAISLMRARASEWGVDAHKVGVLGFSAGGHLCAWVSNTAERSYAPLDAVDRQAFRPDFAVLLYPGHLWDGDDDHLQQPANGLRASAATPPSFIVQAQDDPVDNVHDALVYYIALLHANVPAELHLFTHGGHAFGLRRTEQPITHWPDLLESWLRALAILPKAG